MTLFEFPSQYRERMTIWRICGLLPLYCGLAEGHVFRWFAVNIPMDLLTGGKFNSDIDIIACLKPDPLRGVKHDRTELFYKTWELKVSLLNDDGTINSLKAGKTTKTLKQLQVYREFGSPDVSLLEAYICAPGFLNKNIVFPQDAEVVIRDRFAELKKHGFGYQLLPFGHEKEGGLDVGLLAITFGHTSAGVGETSLKLLSAIRNQPKEPFSRLVKRLNEFIDGQKERRSSLSQKIVFCRACRQLDLVNMKNQYECSHCGADLIVQ